MNDSFRAWAAVGILGAIAAREPGRGIGKVKSIMNRFPRLRTGFVVAAVVIPGEVASAGDVIKGAPPGYEVIIVDDRPGFYQRPRISNRGEVLYSLSQDPPISNIYRYTRDDGIEQLTDGTMNDHWPDISPDGDHNRLEARGNQLPSV